MKAPSSPVPRASSQLLERDLLGRPDRPAGVALALGLDLGVALGRADVDADLVPAEPEQAAVVLAERDQPARRQVEHGGRQCPPRRGAVHDHRPGRRGQVGRRGRHQDRRVVEVDRVLAEPPPVEERPARQPEEDDRGADQADDRVDLARPLERGRVLGRRGGIDLLERDRERAVEVRRLSR